MVKYLIFLLLPLSLSAQDQGLSLPQAIRQAWDRQPGLLGGEAQVDQAKAEAAAARANRLPSLQAQAGWQRTNEPLMAFGTRLDQGRITATDFDPSRLNAPDPISGFGASLTLRQPLYAGGRISAGLAAAQDLAAAAEARQGRLRQEAAAAVVQAYFSVEATTQGVAYAQEALDQAKAVETFTAARAAQGLMLKAEQLRAKAYRAQAEAGVALARQRNSEASHALALLIGGPASGPLLTPLASEPHPPASENPRSDLRGDLEATRLETQAAQAAARAEGGSLKPEVGLELGWGTARQAFGSAGTTWTNVSVGAKWSFSFAQTRRVQAARAAARAADENLRWQQAQAERDRANAASAVATAQAQVDASSEAVQAAEEARRLNGARFEAGLLPLTDRLEAETALAGARALHLSSLLGLRIAEAQQALALGLPVEGVQ